MLSVEPPTERCTIWRRVASLRSAGGMEFCGSGVCCEVAQEPIQIGAGVGDCALRAMDEAARKTAMEKNLAGRITQLAYSINGGVG